jgi:hypothetical protein
VNSEFYGHTREAVFSSSGDRTRATQARAVAGLSMVSRWGGRAAESLFAVLFPSDCRICGTPRLTIFRLPVCEECLAFMPAIAGCVCSVCGERILFLYPVSGIDGEPRCGLCCRILPQFAKVVAQWQLRRWTARAHLFAEVWRNREVIDCAGAHGGRRHRYSSQGMLSGRQKLSIDALRRAGAEVGYSAN